MKLKTWIALMLSLSMFVAFIGCSDDDDENPVAPEIPALEYAGSDACIECHQTIADKIENNGHGYKLNKVENGVAPSYPFSEVPSPPEGYTWDDITYVIGGFGWKARFIDAEGYIITGDAVQYNLETGTWSGYHASEAPGTKPYNCGKCHTTGWVDFDDGGVRQDGLAGMDGSFSEPGVKCEACHGPASRHVVTESADDITVDTKSSMCGNCHFRDSNHLVAAKGGFIRHHEQYDEMLADGHRGLDCVTCHDPHLGQQSLEYSRDAMIAKCTTCHTDVSMASHDWVDCLTCHLPEATKSAVAENKYNGDVKTHIFKINSDSVGMDEMFYNDGGLAKGAVTLDFVCYQCHTDAEGIGGDGSAKTLAELSALAQAMHE